MHRSGPIYGIPSASLGYACLGEFFKKMDYINNHILELNEKRRSEHKLPADNYFYASAALGCMRAEYFKRKFPKEFGIETLKIFFLGDLLHELFQKCIPGEDEVEAMINDDGIIVSGRVDKIDSFGDILEFKTTSNVKYNEEKPSEHHIAQLNLYLHEKKKSEGYIIYIDKRNLKTKKHTIQYSPELYKKTIDHFREISKYLIANEVPPFSEGYSFDKFPCTYCQYKEECLKQKLGYQEEGKNSKLKEFMSPEKEDEKVGGN